MHILLELLTAICTHYNTNNQSYLKLCNLFLQNKDKNSSAPLPLTQALINLKEQQDLTETQVIYLFKFEGNMFSH